MVAAVIAGLVVLGGARSWSEVLLGALGVGAALLGAALDNGAQAVLAIVVFALLIIWLLGAARGILIVK